MKKKEKVTLADASEKLVIFSNVQASMIKGGDGTNNGGDGDGDGEDDPEF